jgi:hypothetical protein
MSDNQRPVRMRVVNNGMAPAAPVATPQRRRNDPAVLAAAAAKARQQQGIGAIHAILFLLACAAGGALVAMSRLTEALGL